MRKLKTIPVFIFLAVLMACGGSRQIAMQNVAYLYEIDKNYLDPKYEMYHVNDSVSKLYYKVQLNQLLYVKLLNTDTFTANFSIHYELTNGYESKAILDSNTFIFSESHGYKLNKSIVGTQKITVKKGSNYVLKIRFTDLNRDKQVIRFVNIRKANQFTSQNFLVTGSDDLNLFRNYLDDNEEVIIHYNNPHINELTVHYYTRNFPIASPPYDMEASKPFNYKPDSVFKVVLKNGTSEMLHLEKHGFYHFMTDTSQTSGLTLYRFRKNYPQVVSTEQMIEPIRYLTTKKEYEIITIAADKKSELDHFWIANSGNPDRAKEMISRYYNRVQDANRFFSSYIEGWKTDRGMVYIVYGLPSVIYHSETFERWVYGESGHYLSLTLTFYKVNNPFTDNDYSLERSPVYKDSWFNAIDVWRR